jgi:L-fucose isomerase-like protein
MYALQCASTKPTALVDLNNNYRDDLNKCVLFHCGAVAPSFFEENPALDCHDMQEYYGALKGRIAPGPVTLFRVSTDDVTGLMRAYCAEGRMTKDVLETFGTYGVVEIENLQSLLTYIGNNGFEHHVAIVKDHVADVLEEVGKYLKWEMHRHSPEEG